MSEDSSEDHDEDLPTLSQNALSALQEFYSKKMEAESLLEQYRDGVRTVQNAIPEDWVSEPETKTIPVIL